MVAMLLAIIDRGDQGELNTWLGALSRWEAVEELTKTYGGDVHLHGEDSLIEDSYGLFQGTSPILHAAKTGKAWMFSAVRDAMRERKVISPFSTQRDFLPRGGGGGYKHI